MSNSNDLYRKALREKMGLKGDKPIVEEDVVTPQTPPTPEDVEGNPEQAEGKIDPQAESVINDVLQFIHGQEQKNSQSLKMLKKFWVYIGENKDKIAKVISK